MREFLGPLLCTLLAVPDNPEAGVLELPKLALAAAAQYGWDPRLPARCGALLDGVRLLAAMARDQYPYCYQVLSRARGSLRALIHPRAVQGEASNDVLYGHEAALVSELEAAAGQLVAAVVAGLGKLGGADRARAELELAATLATVADTEVVPSVG